MKVQVGKKIRNMSRVVRTSIGTVTEVSIKFSKKKKQDKKVVRNIEQKPRHAARATPVERQVEKKAYSHNTDS